MTTSEVILRDLRLSEKRMRHTMGVVNAAKMLASTHFPSLSEENVTAAALMHDFTKEYTEIEQIELCRLYHCPPTDDELQMPKLFHGKTAALIAENRYRLPGEVVDAIRYHTTGRADMAPLEIVIYFADYIEEFRKDEGCVAVRDYYNKLLKSGKPESALFKGLLFSFDTTIRLLLDDGRTIFENTYTARNWIVKKLETDNLR